MKSLHSPPLQHSTSFAEGEREVEREVQKDEEEEREGEQEEEREEYFNLLFFPPMWKKALIV